MILDQISAELTRPFYQISFDCEVEKDHLIFIETYYAARSTMKEALEYIAGSGDPDVILRLSIKLVNPLIDN